MAELDLKYIFNKNHNKLSLYGHRMVTTSLYYNAFIQDTVIESGSEETIKLLSKASADCMLTLMKMYFNDHPDINDDSEKLKIVALLYQGLGYGILDLNDLNDKGGTVRVVHSNVVEILKNKLKKNTEEICHYTNGFIIGGVSSVFQKSLNYYKIADIFDFNKYGYKIKLEES